jgi:formylglycine-generating enzyme required for sulfatase activity
MYRWTSGPDEHELQLVPVPGTDGVPYQFGAGSNRRRVQIGDFHIGSTPVTHGLWDHVMGARRGGATTSRRPAHDVSWNHITGPSGFLERINSSDILRTVAGGDSALRFRLPSETEWEYAARGGPHWRDGFAFSGSNDPDEVAWYGPRWTPALQLAVRTLGWHITWRYLARLRFRIQPPTRTHDVATKAPNQLGIYDMSGNVWEWCHDLCVDDVDLIPGDGTPWSDEGTERRLRGGSHQNWDLHCRVWWRYGIDPDAHDGCIGFRLVLGR